MYQNMDVDLSNKNLYMLLDEEKKQMPNNEIVIDTNIQPQQDSMIMRQLNTKNIVVKFVVILLLLAIVGFVLYLSIFRIGLAGKSFFKGNTFTGLALLSPEIGSLVKLGLGL